MSLLDWLFGKSSRVSKEDKKFERIVKKLVSQDDTIFGDGLDEALAIPDNNPLRVNILDEAIRLRSGKRNVRFYEPDVGGLTVQDETELANAKDQILLLAKERSLLADPEVSGQVVAAFSATHSFDDVVGLAYEIRDIAGLDQCQVFQMLYNRNRSVVVLQTSEGKKTWTQKRSEEISAIKKCAVCQETIEEGAITCPKCGNGVFETVKSGKRETYSASNPTIGDVMSLHQLREELSKFEVVGRTEDGKVLMKRK